MRSISLGMTMPKNFVRLRVRPPRGSALKTSGDAPTPVFRAAGVQAATENAVVGSNSAGQASRLAEGGNPVDAADEQHALLVDLRIAQAVGPRLACVFRPDPIELLGDALAAGFPLPHLLFHRAFDLHPVIGILGIDQKQRAPRVLANPRALRSVQGGV